MFSNPILSALFHGPNREFELVRSELRPLKTGEILVRIEFTTLCRSDLNTFCGKRTEKTPTILGHEIVGRIADFGEQQPPSDCRGETLNIGDRITWAIYAADPDSELARVGIPQKSPDLFKYGHEKVTDQENHHGGLSEYCILRRHTPTVRLRGDVPLTIAALINCSAATVAGAMRLAGHVAGRQVLITGCGMLGVFACAMCSIAGAQRVVAADINFDRLQTALKFGATDTVLIGEEGLLPLEAKPMEVHLDFSGDPLVVENVIQKLGIGGTSILVGATFPQRDLAVNAESIVRRILTIRGLHNYNQDDLVAAVEFVENHHQRFPFAELVDDRFTLTEVNAAFNHAQNSGAYRVGIYTTINNKS